MATVLRTDVAAALWFLLSGPALAQVGSGAGSGEVIDRALAVVAGEVITLSDVSAARDLGLVVPSPDGDPIRQVLSALIDRALILAEVARYAPAEPSDAALDRDTAAVRARFPTAHAFETVLARTGLAEAHVRAVLRRNLLIQAYLDERFATAADRDALVRDWVAGLRRRADVVDLYAP